MRRPIVPSADDRFLRRTGNEQVRKSRRTRMFHRLFGRGLLGVLLLSLIAAMSWGGHQFLTHSDRFTLESTVITGADHIPEAKIHQMTDPYLGQNLFSADLSGLKEDLEALAWVHTAHPKRRIPDTLLIQIVERVPAALVRLHDRLFLADIEGQLLDELGPQHAGHDFPILTGLDGSGRDTLRRKVKQGAELVHALYDLRPVFAHQVSQIDLSQEDAMDLYLSDGGPPLRVSPDILGLNLDNYLAIRNYIDTNYGRIQYVDLRWKDRISIMPAAGRFAHHGAQR